MVLYLLRLNIADDFFLHKHSDILDTRGVAVSYAGCLEGDTFIKEYTDCDFNPLVSTSATSVGFRSGKAILFSHCGMMKSTFPCRCDSVEVAKVWL